MAQGTNIEQGPTGELSPGRSNGHRKRVITAAVVLVLVAALAVGYWYLYLRGWVSTDDAYIDGDQISISSKILGRVVELTKDEGDTTRPGELIVLLDSTDLKAQEAQAEASLQYVRQSVPVAQINLEKAREDFRRAEQQYKGDVIPREQYDHARIAADLAQAQYGAATSQVASAESQLDVVRTQLQNTRITAPETGIVARKWVVVGDIVQPGQPIYTVYDLSDVWITANFEETKLASIRIGEPVEISVDAFAERRFAGRVELIGAATASQFSLIPPNNASGNFTKVTQRVPVRISVVAKDSTVGADPSVLLPGMSVTVKLRKLE